MLRSSLPVLGLAALAAVWAPAACAATTRYQIDVPDGADSAFEIRVRALHPGPLVVAAEWDGPRILSFRLEGPGSPASKERRSGPSPQRIQVAVTDPALSGGSDGRRSSTSAQTASRSTADRISRTSAESWGPPA